MEPGRPLIESANHRNERQRRIRCPLHGVAALQGLRREKEQLDARQARKRKHLVLSPLPLTLPRSLLPPLLLLSSLFVSRLKNVSNFTCTSVFLHKRSRTARYSWNVVEERSRIYDPRRPCHVRLIVDYHRLAQFE